MTIQNLCQLPAAKNLIKISNYRVVKENESLHELHRLFSRFPEAAKNVKNLLFDSAKALTPVQHQLFQHSNPKLKCKTPSSFKKNLSQQCKTSQRLKNLRNMTPELLIPLKFGTSFYLSIQKIITLQRLYFDQPLTIQDEFMMIHSFVRYKHSGGAGKAERNKRVFENKINQLIAKIDDFFPNAKEIFAHLQSWKAVCLENIDYLNLTADEYDNLCAKKKTAGHLYLKKKDCFALIKLLGSLTGFLHGLIPSLSHTLNKNFPEEAVKKLWKVKEFAKEYPSTSLDEKDPFRARELEANEIMFQYALPPPLSQITHHLSNFSHRLQDVFKQLEKVEAFESEKILEFANQMSNACHDVLNMPEEKYAKDYKKLAFRECDLITLEYVHRLYGVPIAKLREAAHHINHIHRFIKESFLCISEDLLRLATGYHDQPKKIESSIRVIGISLQEMERAKQEQERFLAELEGEKGLKGRGKRRKKKRARASHQFAKTLGKGALKKEPAARQSKERKTFSVRALSLTENRKIRSCKAVSLQYRGDPIDLQRKINFQYALTLPFFIQHAQKKISTGNSCRLAVTILHGWMEKTLEIGAKNKGREELGRFHNLWRYRKVLRLCQPIIEDLHRANHWGRWPYEMDLLWNRYSTLPGRPKVFAWLKEQGDGLDDKQTGQINEWLKQGEMVSLEFFPKEQREVALHMVSALPSQLKFPRLVDALNKAQNIKKKTLWIKQWIADLTHLKEILSLLWEGGFESKLLPVLVQHTLLLVTGIVQSPLYAIEVKKRGAHSLHHDLKVLWTSMLPLSQVKAQKFSELMENISRIHRYPFETKEVCSKAHRLYLNAMAIGLHPELNDNFKLTQTERKEGEIDKEGRPYLKKYLNSNELRREIVKWVEHIVLLTQGPLADQLSE